MIPLRLTARNVRSYAELDVTFGEGVLALAGPNGAGKSTICDLIDTALFCDGARELAPLLRLGETELELGLYFEHAGRDYHVERSYSSAGRGKTRLNVDTVGEDGARLNQETVAATQTMLEGFLGFNRDTFRASAFCRQGDARRFCDAQPRERKQLLADILRLDIWDRLLTVARADKGEHFLAVGSLQARAEAAEGVVAERDARAVALYNAETEVAAATWKRQAAELALEAHRAALGAARAQAERRRTHAAELISIDVELARLYETLEKAERAGEAKERLSSDLAELEPLAAEAPRIEQELADARAVQQRYVIAETERRGLVTAIAQGVERAKEQREKANALDARATGTERCDRCQQVLGVESRAAAIASLLEEANAADREAKARTDRLATLAIPDAAYAEEKVRDLEQALGGAQMAAKQAAVLQSMIRGAEEAASALGEDFDARLAEVQERQKAARAELEALPPVIEPEGIEGDLIMAVGAARDREHAAIGVLEVARDKVNAVALAEAQLADIQAELETAREYGAMLELAEQAYGRNGVPALIIESRAVPELEAQANDVLERWTAPYRVELRTQRELKGGGQAEALDIICLDGGAFERPFETFSGGEQTRIAVALRIGLARLLARRRGANSRLLVIDEPEGLDAEGMARLPALLESLESEYEVILVVSHQPQLATAFPRVLRVSKDGGVSRVDAGVEAVAA